MDGASTSKPKLILLVGKPSDDTISRQLTDSGYLVLATESTKDVARFAQETKFSLVILELDLPEGDLLNCANKLRHSCNRSTPFVGLLKSDRADYNEITCLKVGLHDYVQMPGDNSRFKQTIERWIV